MGRNLCFGRQQEMYALSSNHIAQLQRRCARFHNNFLNTCNDKYSTSEHHKTTKPRNLELDNIIVECIAYRFSLHHCVCVCCISHVAYRIHRSHAHILYMHGCNATANPLHFKPTTVVFSCRCVINLRLVFFQQPTFFENIILLVIYNAQLCMRQNKNDL